MLYSNDEPLANVDILQSECPRLIEELDVQSVLPPLVPFLSVDEQDQIEVARSKGAKTSALIDCLSRRTLCKSYKAFNAFITTLGGTQPELFTLLVGRSPTPNEADFCVENVSKHLRDNVIKKGHSTDSPLDEQIDLDSQHVQLQIIRSEPDKVDFARTDVEVLYLSDHDKQLPHEYQREFSDVERRGGSIPACDILSAGGNHAKSVLLSGRAGVGKTTTLQWLARQWALNNWATGFTVLFLVQLRMILNTDTSLTAIELLTLYGLFQVTAEGGQKVLCSWLKKAAERTIILLDGVDEILGFAQKLASTPKITDLNQKAQPIDICINILRGDLLPGCTVICTSRPFSGLSRLSTNSVLEIIGLSRRQVREYVESRHPTKANEIISVLDRNPILMSVCGITFYCMAVSSLLCEGVDVLDEDVQTYTRLTAFIMIQYMSRTLLDWPFVIQVRPYFSKLAHLAHIGIFQSKEYQGLSKLVFNEYDLSEVELTPLDLESIKKGGILHIKEMKTGKRMSIIAEFLHLSIQEMLAVAHLLLNPLPSKESVMELFSGGQFNMALMYLFGFHDTKSDWIKDICRAVRPSWLKPNSDVKLLTFSVLEELQNEPKGNPNTALKICQLVYESQEEDMAKSVLEYVVPDGILRIQQTTMTAIDIMAVAFVCKYSKCLENITLTNVNGDCAFLKIMSHSLIKLHSNTLRLLDLSRNNICDCGAKALAEVLKTHETLEKIFLTCNNIGDLGAKVIGMALEVNSTLTHLVMRGNDISDDGAKALGEALKHNRGLQMLDLHGNQIGDDGAEYLAAGLQCNTTLMTLNISFNAVQVPGAIGFSNLIHHSTSLQYLNLAGNNIFDEGARALAKMLLINDSMCAINVCHCKIGGAGRKALLKVQEMRPGLIILI